MTDQSAEKVRVPITIRMPEAILKAIDDQVKKKELPISRNHWIVEAKLLINNIAENEGLNGD